MTRPDLGPNQLSWARLNLPHFRDMERRARAAIRETDASHARYGSDTQQTLARLAEIDCAPNDRSK